jgi:hypothetical protein
MKIDNIRGAVPVYQSIPEHVASIISLMNNNIVIGDYSIYRGVLVFWDDDYDTRILTFIDNNEMLIPKMLAVACSGVKRPVFRSKSAGLPEQSRPS